MNDAGPACPDCGYPLPVPRDGASADGPRMALVEHRRRGHDGWTVGVRVVFEMGGSAAAVSRALVGLGGVIAETGGDARIACERCGGAGIEVCPVCHDGGVRADGEDCVCAPRECEACGGTGERTRQQGGDAPPEGQAGE